jgi:hypothetical protein
VSWGCLVAPADEILHPQVQAQKGRFWFWALQMSTEEKSFFSTWDFLEAGIEFEC